MTGQGRFIVFEGGDGVGKSTHTALLARRLTKQGRSVCRTFEPGDSPLGRQLRQLLLDPTSDVTPRAEALLYAADKAQHVETVIKPALVRGDVVLCDRYVDSMIAYQGAGRALDPKQVADLAWWGAGNLTPDLTVVLDVPFDQALGEKVGHDRLEQAGRPFHERVRAFFLDQAAADPDHYVVIDARQDQEVVAAEIWARVESLLS
ncbi:MAG: dTMP kinase [Propionibacteriaceae bacterium]|jgi:dTMP kinase|nr:dTMP kinase [Propionibacteriaceae bacterium]